MLHLFHFATVRLAILKEKGLHKTNSPFLHNWHTSCIINRQKQNKGGESVVESTNSCN